MALAGMQFLKLPATALTPPSPKYIGAVNIHAFNDGWFYYSLYSEDNDRYGDGLYRMRADGTGAMKLLEKEEIAAPGDFSLYFNDGWIYFRNVDDDYALYKMKPDGTGKIKLTDDSSLSSINFSDNWVYYNTGHPNSQTVRVRKDGTEREVICEHGLSIVYATDDLIYYQQYDSAETIGNTASSRDSLCLYTMRTDGTEVTRLATDLSVLNVIDGWFYYRGLLDSYSYHLSKMRLDGTDVMHLDIDRLRGDSFIFSDGRVYSSSYVGEDLRIIGIDLDNAYTIHTNCDDISYIIAVEDGWIYYQSESEFIGSVGTAKYEEIQGKIYAMRLDIDGSEKREVVFSNHPFGDILEGDWFYDDVVYMSTHRLMNGTSGSEFGPNTTITRAMAVTVLYRMAGSPDAATMPNPLSDVPGGAYFTDAVKWATANDIILGYPDGSFGPNDNISRQDLATILARYGSFAGISLTTTGGYPGFEDDANISGYAREAIEALVKSGVIEGKPGGIVDPRGDASRAEFAAMMHRFLLMLGLRAQLT